MVLGVKVAVTVLAVPAQVTVTLAPSSALPLTATPAAFSAALTTPSETAEKDGALGAMVSIVIARVTATPVLPAMSVAVAESAGELYAVALLVLLLKGALIPVLLHRTALSTGGTQETSHRVHPTAGLLWAALLTTVAFLAARPLVSASGGPLVKVAPVGLALVLLGFLILLTRHQAVSQLVGFVVLDNGIATVAFLTSGGVPLVVEIGVMIDVLFVVVILRVLAGRMRSVFGATDLDDLTELRD